MTKDELLEAIRKTAKKLGHTPSKREFLRESSLNERHILKHFARWNDAVKASGLEPNSSNTKIGYDELLKDWAEVVRTLKKIPTMAEYRHGAGEYSIDALRRRCGAWSKIPDLFKAHFNNSYDYADVFLLIHNLSSQAESSVTGSNLNLTKSHIVGKAASGIVHPKLGKRPIYGNPLNFRGLLHEPVNEQGVVLLFGMVFSELGYAIEIVKPEFPDCIAKRRIKGGNLELVRIEFEFESRNFLEHGHSVDDCDVIVCWRHNWTECPSTIQVLELSKAITNIDMQVQSSKRNPLSSRSGGLLSSHGMIIWHTGGHL